MPFTVFRRLFHKFSTGAGFRGVSGLVLGLIFALSAAAQNAPSTLFRVFLNDGRVLTAYGEWARLEDRIVFSMPTRPGDPAAELHLVTVPAIEVDWERTERYAFALRARAYAATRGDSDFARLSDEVARTLNAVATIKDPAARLAHAEAARRALSTWPGASFGYRAVEVREILGMLDEVIIDLRSAAGPSGTALALVAPPPVPPDEPLLPEPTDAEIAEQLLTAVDMAATPAERTSLLQSLLGLLDRAASVLPSSWATYVRARADRLLGEERRLDAAYAELRTTTLAAGTRSAARADVRGIEKLRAAVRDADARLGGQRPGEVEGLLATLQSQLESARAIQLARDQWELRAPDTRRYRRAVTTPLRTIRNNTAALEDVRAQAGPQATRLPAIIERWHREGLRLDRITPPADLQSIHALFRSAWAMAEQAFTLRLAAAAGNDSARAQQASSAAAGALMLLGRARADLDAALTRPTLPAP